MVAINSSQFGTKSRMKSSHQYCCKVSSSLWLTVSFLGCVKDSELYRGKLPDVANFINFQESCARSSFNSLMGSLPVNHIKRLNFQRVIPGIETFI